MERFDKTAFKFVTFTFLPNYSLPPPSLVSALPPFSFIFFLLSDLQPSLSFSLYLEREFWKRERERIRGGGWRGGVGLYKSCLLHPPRSQKDHAEPREGNVHCSNLNCTQGTPTGTHNLTPIQVRRPSEKRVRLKKIAWPLTLIQNLLHFSPFEQLLAFCYIWLTGGIERPLFGAKIFIGVTLS